MGQLEGTGPARAAICIDFDDTLRGEDDGPIAGAQVGLATLRSWGYRLVVSSARFSPVYGQLNGARMGRVRDWLDRQGMGVDEVSYVVPAAEAYVDDRGLRFEGSWPSLIEALAGRHWRNSKRVSLGLECLIEDGVAREGALQGIAHLRREGYEVVVSAGPFVQGDDLQGEQDRLGREVRDAGFGPSRVEVAKLSSEVYVGARACPFEGAWHETLRELEQRVAGAGRSCG